MPEFNILDDKVTREFEENEEEEETDSEEEEWLCKIDVKTGRPFYFSNTTRRSTWTKPLDESKIKDLTTTNNGLVKEEGFPIKKNVNEEWIQVYSIEHKRHFFFNKITRTSSWTPPNNSPSVLSIGEIEDEDKNGWVKRVDPVHNRTFFFNKHTRQSTWTEPSNEDLKPRKFSSNIIDLSSRDTIIKEEDSIPPPPVDDFDDLPLPPPLPPLNISPILNPLQTSISSSISPRSPVKSNKSKTESKLENLLLGGVTVAASKQAYQEYKELTTPKASNRKRQSLKLSNAVTSPAGNVTFLSNATSPSLASIKKNMNKNDTLSPTEDDEDLKVRRHLSESYSSYAASVENPQAFLSDAQYRFNTSHIFAVHPKGKRLFHQKKYTAKLLGKDNSLVITDDAKGKIKRIFKLLDIVTCIKDRDDKNHLILITPAYEEKEFKLGFENEDSFNSFISIFKICQDILSHNSLMNNLMSEFKG